MVAEDELVVVLAVVLAVALAVALAVVLEVALFVALEVALAVALEVALATVGFVDPPPPKLSIESLSSFLISSIYATKFSNTIVAVFLTQYPFLLSSYPHLVQISYPHAVVFLTFSMVPFAVVMFTDLTFS